MKHSATYSPEDDKIRIYPAHRLSPEDFAAVKAAGYTWAPKQELFVAVWNPQREDVALTLADDIDAEDMSAAERAEARAARFETYSAKREADANSAHARAHSIMDGIPLGQPILVGHHSERHARKDAERIDNATRAAVKNWNTARYWEARAAGLLRHAERMDRKDVRARRIKTLEAEARKIERSIQDTMTSAAAWQTVRNNPTGWTRTNRETGETRPMDSHEVALKLAGSEYGHDYDGLRNGTTTAEEATANSLGRCWEAMGRLVRWREHLAHRIAYERAVLEAQGGKPLPTAAEMRAARPKPPELLNLPESVEVRGMYGNPPHKLPVVTMTSAEYAAINRDYKGTRTTTSNPPVRVRIALHGRGSDRGLVQVFLSDKKPAQIPAGKAAA